MERDEYETLRNETLLEYAEMLENEYIISRWNEYDLECALEAGEIPPTAHYY